MRSSTPSRRRRLAPIAIVSASAVALGIVGLVATPANAASPSNDADAEGQFLTGGGTVNINNLAEVAPAWAASPGTPSNSNPLTLDLASVPLNLGNGVQLPSGTTLGSILDVGAVGQYAAANTTGASTATSATVSQGGSIDTSTGGTPTGDAKVTLTPLLGAVTGASGVASAVSLDLGAVQGWASGTPGSPVSYSGSYSITGGTLNVTSPAISTLATGLEGGVSTLTSSLNSALSSSSTLSSLGSALSGAVSSVAGGLVSVSDPNATITATLPDLSNVVSSATTVTSTDGAVSINLGSGSIAINLAKLLADDPSYTESPAGTLDGLPANTHLLSTPTVSSALNGDLTQVVDKLVTNVENTVTQDIDNTQITITESPTVSTLLLGNIATVNVTVNGTLGGLLGVSGAATPTVTSSIDVLSSVPGVSTIVNTLTGDLTTGLTTATLPAVESALGSVLNPLLGSGSDLATTFQTLGSTADSVLTDSTTGLLPTLQALVDPVVNVQQPVSSNETVPTFTTTGADAGFAERAIQLNLLPVAGATTPASSIALGNATVYSTNAAASISASTTTPAPGSAVTISGTGFDPNEPVTITYADASGATIGSTTATPGADGTFSGASFTVPSTDGNGDTITATATQSSSGRTASTKVTVTTSTSGTATSGTSTSGTSTSGTSTSGTATSGTATSGTSTSGTSTSGTATSGTATSGTATTGTATVGTSGTATAGSATIGTATSATATAGTATAATSGTATAGTATVGTATAGTATAGTATVGTTGTATSGTSGTATTGTATTGTATTGTATTGTATSGTATSGTATTGTATAGTATSGTSTGGTTKSITPGKVTITGTKQVGGTLVGNPGTWSPSGTTLTYKWTLPNGTVLGTGQTLVVPSSAAGKTITLTVTGSKAGYTSATGKASAAIANPTKPKVTRISGADRYATAVAISKDTFPVAGSARVVFVATGQNFPDALSAGPAAAKMDGPLLLTQTNSLNSGTASEIKRLKPAEVIIVGQQNAVSNGVEAAIKKIVANTVRWGGADRYATSLIIAKNAFKTASSAFVATGVTFPDALSASAYAGSKQFPVVLVNGKGSSVPSALTSYLKSAKISSLKIAGGPNAVSSTISSKLKSATGKPETRYAGADRYETSIAINKEFTTGPLAYLATGVNFPDALSGAAAAAKNGAPLYVVQPTCVPSGVLSQFSAWHTGTVKVLGGPNALNGEVADLKSC